MKEEQARKEIRKIMEKAKDKKNISNDLVRCEFYKFTINALLTYESFTQALEKIRDQYNLRVYGQRVTDNMTRARARG